MYLLDTNILSELIRKKPNANLMVRLRGKPARELYTSSICVMELRYGSMLRGDANLFWQRISQEIISAVKILPIGEKEATIAGDILAELRSEGRMIGIEDVLIAASAKKNGFRMVTGNIRHFTRIKGLQVENWLDTMGA